MLPWLAALAAAWILPLAASWARLDWLVPVLAVLAVAALLRVGTGLLDRLVPALALVYGGTCVAGLGLSAWPWHLAPVPVGGVGLSVIVLGALATGRRPAAPRRLGLDGATVAAGTALCAGVALWPLARRGFPERLSVFMHVEDFSRHLMLYDTIRGVGGYLFLHRAAATPLVGDPGFLTYPQGSHLVAALGENFLRHGGDPAAWAGDFVWWTVGTYVWMCLAVLWGLRRVAGPAGRTAVIVPAVAFAAAYLSMGDPVGVLAKGYPQEMAALALVAVLVALACRPARRVREQVVLLGVLLAGISLTYYLFLPLGLAAAGAWALVYRRRLRRHPVFVPVAAVLAAAACAVEPALNRAARPGTVLLQGGQASPVNRGTVVALALVAVAGLAVLAGRRSPVGRAGLWILGAQVGLAVGVAGYTASLDGPQRYFMIKILHEAVVVCLVLAGATVRLVTALSQRPAGARRRAGLAAAVAALTLLPLTALVDVTAAGRAAPSGWAYLTARDAQDPAAARIALAVARAWPARDGRVVVVLAGDAWTRFLATVYGGVFRHRYGATYRYGTTMRPWIGPHPLHRMEVLLSAGGPLRLLAADPATLAELRRFAARQPAGRVLVVPLDQVP